ncbi:MAG: thioredoxin [Clostridiales bacterium]|jgi:hypothetical protein|nr:thioredoxin [Clostridiales bacterium]
MGAGKPEKIQKYLKYLIILASFVFILLGAYRNEVSTVFTKAVNICLECIGIG